MKPFCSKCRFFRKEDTSMGYNRTPKYIELCVHGNNRIDSYLGEKEGFASTPAKKNKDNNCNDFEAK